MSWAKKSGTGICQPLLPRPRHLPEWPFNLFAMVHGKTQADVDKQIQQIADLLGAANLGCDVLYSTKF